MLKGTRKNTAIHFFTIKRFTSGHFFGHVFYLIATKVIYIYFYLIWNILPDKFRTENTAVIYNIVLGAEVINKCKLNLVTFDDVISSYYIRDHWHIWKNSVSFFTKLTHQWQVIFLPRGHDNLQRNKHYLTSIYMLNKGIQKSSLLTKYQPRISFIYFSYTIFCLF